MFGKSSEYLVYEDLALRDYEKKSIGTWLVPVAKKLRRQGTEVEDKAPPWELGTGAGRGRETREDRDRMKLGPSGS